MEHLIAWSLFLLETFRAPCNERRPNLQIAQLTSSSRLLATGMANMKKPGMTSMKKEEARRAVLSEYDRWAKNHPNDARMMGGHNKFVLFVAGEHEPPADARLSQ